MVCMDFRRCMCDNVRREKLCRIVFVYGVRGKAAQVNQDIVCKE